MVKPSFNVEHSVGEIVAKATELRLSREKATLNMAKVNFFVNFEPMIFRFVVLNYVLKAELDCDQALKSCSVLQVV